MNGDESRVRDRMAEIRTTLAGERTFLAYLRSSLALLATGATIIHFITNRAAVWAGMILVALGLALLAYGGLRLRATRRAIREAAESEGATLRRLDAANMKSGPTEEKVDLKSRKISLPPYSISSLLLD